MDFLKDIFADKALTYAELEAALKDNKDIKLGNLATGQYVDKAKLDGKIGELNTANQTIKDLQEAVKKFDGVDVEKLKKDAADWETKYNADIGKMKLDSALEMALVAGKAKNSKAVKALLDMDAIKLDGDKLLGLDDQLTKLKTDSAYLFEADKSTTTTVDSGGDHGDPLGSGDAEKFIAAAMNAAGLPADKK
ncbi:MAG TPA: phage scaffolding protein [Syntrophomonas sp.]|nr:phage scaffolding protein [Syntrophomonas sp.]